MLLSANAYAYSWDPWLTPRIAPYMIVYWRVSAALRDLSLLLCLACAVAFFYSHSLAWRTTFVFCLAFGLCALWFACWYVG